MNRKSLFGRRSFMKKSAAGVIGAGIAAGSGWARTAQEEKNAPLKIKEYRTLGQTGFKVSDIGAGSIMDEGVL
ncbi:MAG: twin-arginine translocation signal domain-containing protein, partial [Candidatus Aminicenantaceae bacterium]